MPQQILKVGTSALKIHPRNSEFYDDISGEEYERFKSSIALEGILSPLIVAYDMTIISGHQRFRAAKELGIEEVPVIVREDLKDKDDILRNLIAANFGRLKNDAAKQRKAIAEYVDLVGYKNGEAGRGGRDRKSETTEISQEKGRTSCPSFSDNNLSNSSEAPRKKLTLPEIAAELGISDKELQRTLRIERNLTPAMKDFLDNGRIGKNIASKCIAGLSQKEQDELISRLDATKRYTDSQLQSYIDEIKQLKMLCDSKSRANQDLERAFNRQLRENQQLKERQASQTAQSAQGLNESISPLTISPEAEKQINKLKEELASARNDLASTRNDLSAAKQDLSRRQNELSQQKTELTRQHQELSAAQRDLSTTQSEIARREAEIKKLRQELSEANKRREETTKTYESPDSYSSVFADSKGLAELMYKIQDMLDKDLSPLKFSRMLDRIDRNDVSRRNLGALLDKVDSWSRDIHKILNVNEVVDVDVVAQLRNITHRVFPC